MEFHVQSAGVADWLAFGVSAPQRGRGRMTVGTREPNAAGGGQPPLGFDQWSVDAVHLVVEPACVAQVVARAVSPPEWGGHGSTVDAFSPLRVVVKELEVGVAGGSRGAPAGQVVQHGAVEGRGAPRGAHLRAHVGGVGAGVGAAEAPAVLLPAQRAAVRGGLPGGAGREGEAGRDGRVGGARVVGGGLGAGLRPDGVAGGRAGLLGGAAALEVGQAGEHGGDPGGGHVDGGGGRPAVHEAPGPLVGWGAVVRGHGQALIHRGAQQGRAPKRSRAGGRLPS